MNLTPPQAIHEAKAIFFDFDGVILDTEWPIYLTWAHLFEREGFTLEKELYAKCIGSDFETWSPQTYLESLSGKTYDWDHENAQRQIKLEAEIENYLPMKGATKLIQSLAEKPTAVVSSSTHLWVDRWLDKHQLAPYFNTTVCRGDAPRIKPAPDLYLKAASRLNIQPADCLVIEDSHNGLLSAQAAGMKIIVVPNRLTSVFDFSSSTYLIDSLNDCLPSASLKGT